MTATFATKPRPSRPSFGWFVMVVAATLIGLASARYLAGLSTAPPPLKPNMLRHPLGFYVHISAATIALLIGPYQFLSTPRRRGAALHRAMGVIYATVVAIGGAAALVVAPSSNGGPVAAAGFITLALLWWITTGAAVRAILRGDRAAHRHWMYRSYALTLAGVTLRLYLPVAIFGPWGFSAPYAVIAWLCWAPNLAAAEVLSRRGAAAGSRSLRREPPRSSASSCRSRTGT